MAAENIDINALFAAQDVTQSNSKKDMVYTADDGKLYKVNINENMGEAMGFLDYTDTTVLTALPYVRIKAMRQVHASDASGRVKQSFPVGTPTKSIFSEGGTIKIARKGSADGLVLTVTGTTGEKKSIATPYDTGQNSGDVS